MRTLSLLSHYLEGSQDHHKTISNLTPIDKHKRKIKKKEKKIQNYYTELQEITMVIINNRIQELARIHHVMK